MGSVRVPAGGKCRVELGGDIRLGSEAHFKLILPKAPSSSPELRDLKVSSVPSSPQARRNPRKTRIVE